VTTITITGPATFRNDRPYPFCPGCGHDAILDALNDALVLRGATPDGVVIVSDIGCAGLSDQYFATSAFHGLHGRSITYASGIKLARPDLDVIVIMGDGGAGIGGAHLLSAARRNLGITVLVFNNLNFGMTGGQHSVATPTGAVTTTTPLGNIERPLDICGTVAVNGAGYVYRGTSYDDDLAERIAEGMASGGFALLDIWELCSAYFMRSNKFGKKSIERTLDELGFEARVARRREIPEYSAAYREAFTGVAERPTFGTHGLEPTLASTLTAPFSIVLAGAAGGRVRSAARLVGTAGILSGLWAAQRDDYPVTVQTGHSVSTIMLSPAPIDLVGVAAPDALVIVAPEGAAKVATAARAMAESATVYALEGFTGIETSARVRTLDPVRSETRLFKADLALAALVAVAQDHGLIPRDALDEAAVRSGPFADRNAAIVRSGASLLEWI